MCVCVFMCVCIYCDESFRSFRRQTPSLPAARERERESERERAVFTSGPRRVCGIRRLESQHHSTATALPRSSLSNPLYIQYIYTVFIYTVYIFSKNILYMYIYSVYIYMCCIHHLCEVVVRKVAGKDTRPLPLLPPES